MYAFLGGLLPALLWLWFFLLEDRKHPEPKSYIVEAFFFGMVAVALVIPIEQYARVFFNGTALLLSWAAIEEILKYAAATSLFAWWRRGVDEPIDELIYMITVALGFAALENALFLATPLSRGISFDSFLTGNLRFLGATLLHVLASSIVGLALALSFYYKGVYRAGMVLTGLTASILLHALFNVLILKTDGRFPFLISAFAFVWIGIIVILLMFEKVKRIHRPIALFIKK